MTDTPRYEDEVLGEDDDDGTMPASKEELAKAVIGHKIVSAEKVKFDDRPYAYYGEALVLTLDDGTRVRVHNNGDCCAFTEVEAFLLNPELVDHVILGVGTTDEYNTWHIYADAGDVMQLTVGWSAGNPFYYGYGLSIDVVPA